MQLQLDRALTLGESIESHGSAMVDLGGRMEIHGEALLEIGARIAERGGEIADALPALERAVAIATPLEGTVERLGRALDRLPGGRPRAPSSRPPKVRAQAPCDIARCSMSERRLAWAWNRRPPKS